MGNSRSKQRRRHGSMEPVCTPPQAFHLGPASVSGTPQPVEELEICSHDIEAGPPEYGSRMVLMRGGLGLMEPPEVTQWQTYMEIYLMENQLTELPEDPRCPVLLVLFLNRNYKLRTISPSFFNYMPDLEILNLSRTRMKSLPESLFGLSCLKRLFLTHCEMLSVLPPKIGELQQLEVLDLEGTEIMDLPQEVAKLTKLTCLELSFCPQVNRGTKSAKVKALIPQGTISALSQLEELSFDVNAKEERWESVVEASVDEVCGLLSLDTLKLYLPRVKHLRKFKWFGTSMLSRSLSHFKFIVGSHDERIMSRLPVDLEFEIERWDRSLKYVNGMGVPIDIQKMLRHTMAFFLDRHANVMKLSDFGIENMEQLKCCIIGECNEIQVIIDGTDIYDEADRSEIILESWEDNKSFLGSLEYLYVYHMKSLRGIYEGPMHRGCLSHLKSLALLTCPQLTTIFTPGLLKNLDSLEELNVEDCPLVLSLVMCEDTSIYESTHFLPNLKRISLFSLPELISISNGLRIAPNLERMSISDCPNLKSPSTDGICCNHRTGTKANFVDNASSTWELLNSFGPQEGPGGDEDSPFRLSNKEDWLDGDDEKVSKERISPRKDDLDSHSSTSVEDKESMDKDEVGNAPSVNISELVCNVSPEGSFRRRITSWQKGERLGSGSFGTVYEGISDDGFFFAIKEVSLLDQGSQGKQSILQLEQEISLLTQFEHENIVRYLGTDKDDKKLYIFLELMTKGSLATLYHKYNVRDSQVSAYTRQILNGLKYLHDQNVVHRDIKCANILVDASGSVKLADFGLAKATKMNDAKSSKGTALWMAPEVVNLKNRGYGLAADIWSLGCTVLEMLTRRPPYSPLEGMQALFRIGRGKPPPVPDSLSRDAQDLILRCLQVNPDDRPSAAELLDHPFVRKPPTSSGFASPCFDSMWS